MKYNPNAVMLTSRECLAQIDGAFPLDYDLVKFGLLGTERARPITQIVSNLLCNIDSEQPIVTTNDGLNVPFIGIMALEVETLPYDDKYFREKLGFPTLSEEESL